MAEGTKVSQLAESVAALKAESARQKEDLQRLEGSVREGQQ